MTALLGAFSEDRAKTKEKKPLISLSLFSRSDAPPRPPAFVCICVHRSVPYAFCPKFLVVSRKKKLLRACSVSIISEVQICNIFKRLKLETTQLLFNIRMDKL